jgi:hypothetical protein
MSFKVGDKVRCIDASGYAAVTKGLTYIVLEASDKYIRLQNDDNLEWFYLARQFELVEASTGIKHDNGKPPISLIPVEAILGEADVFAFGAAKYGKHNFRHGMEHTRLLDAAMRHILAIVKGEDIDVESGKPHWAHARCCLAMYAYYQTNNVGTDDRYTKFLKEDK